MSRYAAVCLCLLAPLAAVAATPHEVQLARAALQEAKDMLATNKTLPPQAAYRIGYLEAVLGDLPGGLTTIASAPDPTGVDGPRWQAFRQTALTLAADGQATAVQDASAKLQGADRAAFLLGLAEAQLATPGLRLQGILNAQEAGVEFPAPAARLLIDQATERTEELGGDLPAAVSRAYELARRIDPALRDAAGRSVQAEQLTRLALLHGAAGRHDAALQALMAIADPHDRQQPLLALALDQARQGQAIIASGTAVKLSCEIAAPGPGASLQATAYERLAAIAAGRGETETARDMALACGESALRCIDNAIRVKSLLLASEALSRAGVQNRASALAARALSEIHVADQATRALALLLAGRAQYAAGQAEVGRTTFVSAREVVPLAKDPETVYAAVTIPAAAGLTDEAAASLALLTEPAQLRVARQRLAWTLAENGYIDQALAVVETLGTATPADKQARIDALEGVARSLEAAAAEPLLRQALELAGDPADLPRLLSLTGTAAGLGLAEVALAGYGRLVVALDTTGVPTALRQQGLTYWSLIQSALAETARSLPAGAPSTGVLEAIRAAAGASTAPLTNVLAAATLAEALLTRGAPAGRELLALARTAAGQLAPPTEAVRVTAELAALAGRLGQSELAGSLFDEAEVAADELPEIRADLLLTLAEGQAVIGRVTARRFLLRSVLTLENFQKEGSSDLARLARVATYGGQPSDAQAMLRRVWRAPERLEGYLALAGWLAGQAVEPLRPAGPFEPRPVAAR